MKSAIFSSVMIAVLCITVILLVYMLSLQRKLAAQLETRCTEYLENLKTCYYKEVDKFKEIYNDAWKVNDRLLKESAPVITELQQLRAAKEAGRVCVNCGATDFGEPYRLGEPPFQTLYVACRVCDQAHRLL